MSEKSSLTTLCYIEKKGAYLMMHRTKKEGDINKDKWIGVGGHFEADESPEECLLREVREETGIILNEFSLRGIITFSSDRWQTEYMFLYTAKTEEEPSVFCKEGELLWVDKKDVGNLSLWEGDRIFLSLLETEEKFFSLKLRYVGDKLIEAALNGNCSNLGENFGGKKH